MNQWLPGVKNGHKQDMTTGIKGSMREIFVVMVWFCVLTEVVVTQSYTHAKNYVEL